MSDSDWQKTWIVGPIDPSDLNMASIAIGDLAGKQTGRVKHRQD